MIQGYLGETLLCGQSHRITADRRPVPVIAPTIRGEGHILPPLTSLMRLRKDYKEFNTVIWNDNIKPRKGIHVNKKNAEMGIGGGSHSQHSGIVRYG
jgi:hypothetical protein